MGVPIIDTGPMTVKDFYAFTDTRPDNEKWELIDGEAVLNASPSRPHQRIIKNLSFILTTFERRPGFVGGASRSGRSRVRDQQAGAGCSGYSAPGLLPDPLGRDRSDVIVAFEILSPSTEQHDLRWKYTAYTGLASLTHYIVVAQDRVEAVVFTRDDGFAERRYRSLDKSIALPSIGISLPLSEIYHGLALE